MKAYKKKLMEKKMLQKRVLKKVVCGGNNSFVQRCLSFVSLLDFLKALQTGINILSIEIRNSPFQARISVNAPKKISKSFHSLKVNQLRTSFEVSGSYKGKTKEEILSSVRDLCRMYGVPERDITVRNVLLERNGGLAYLVETSKKITDVSGKVNRVTMLGLESISADNSKAVESHSIMDSLSPGDFVCNLVTVTKKIAYCSYQK
jgi:hypothetical protein